MDHLLEFLPSALCIGAVVTHSFVYRAASRRAEAHAKEQTRLLLSELKALRDELARRAPSEPSFRPTMPHFPSAQPGIFASSSLDTTVSRGASMSAKEPELAGLALDLPIVDVAEALVGPASSQAWEQEKAPESAEMPTRRSRRLHHLGEFSNETTIPDEEGALSETLRCATLLPPPPSARRA